MAAPVAFGSSPSRGEIRAAAAGHSHNHSNTGSKPHLVPQLVATWILNHWARSGIKPTSSWTSGWVLNPLSHNGNSKRVYSFYFYFLFFVFLGLHLLHMEVLRPGVQVELQMPAYTTAIAMPDPQPQQHQIQATSATYTTAYGNAKSLTHWARPGIEPVSSWTLARFVSAEPSPELLTDFLILAILVGNEVVSPCSFDLHFLNY